MKYRAFISYSQKDKEWARKLHRSLESFRVPMGAVADISAADRSLGKIFRDDDEMGASESLGDALEQALASSETLIVVCSPNSAQSKWVDREVRRFKQLNNGRVFAIIVDGAPNANHPDEECFCPSLRFKVNADGELTDTPDEPLAPDWRKEGLARIKVRLAAGIIGVDYDQLWQREKRRKRRNAAIAVAGSVTGIAAILTAGLLNTKAGLERRSNELTVLARNALDAHYSAELEADRGATAERALRFAVLASRPSGLHEVSDEVNEVLQTSAFESRALSQMTSHRASVRFARFVRGTELVVSIDDAHQAFLWNTKSGSIEPLGTTGIPVLAISDDGQWLICAEAGNRISVRSTQSGNIESEIPIDIENIQNTTFSKDGTLFAVSMNDTSVRVYDIASAKVIADLGKIGGDIYKLEFDQDTTEIVVASERSNAFTTKTALSVWDIATAKLIPWPELAKYSIPIRENNSAALFLDSRLVEFYRNQEGYFYFLEDGSYEAGREGPNPALPMTQLYGMARGTAGFFTDAYYYGMGDFVTAGEDGTVRVWYLVNNAVYGGQQNSEMFRLEGHMAGVSSIALNEELTRAVTGSTDGEVRLWDVSFREDREAFSELERAELLKRVCDPVDGLLRGALATLTAADLEAAPQLKGELGEDVCVPFR